MRNAAQMLGVIGGIIGMIVGIASFGFVELIDWAESHEASVADWQVVNPALVKAISLLSPLLAITGGALARSQPVAAGVCMLLSAAGMFHAFGFGAFTMFPIAMAGLGGLLALAARRPDEA